MFQSLAGTANRLIGTLRRGVLGESLSLLNSRPLQRHSTFQRLERLVLTDEVSRTLFQEYQAHRDDARGEEEIGWVLLGHREVDSALVLATLPAGTKRNAGVAHVQFNTDAQALASRIVRQWDKRLVTLGVVHTHPGSLRHPSDGDYDGDSHWVSSLRGGEGVFGIGTVDIPTGNGVQVGTQPKPNVQGLGELLISWYALGKGDGQYRPLEVQLTLGPDLALRLHGLWTTVEAFAESLERLSKQQAGLSFDVVPGRKGSALAVCLRLAEQGTALRVVLEGKESAFYLQRGDELLSVNAPAEQLDRSVYLLLAEIATIYQWA
jgi:hypothetical protein